MRTAIACAIALAWPIAASAGEGQVEINHARAIAGGVTVGDAPLYPVTLSQPGNYRLTSDLAMPDADTSGILVTADDVRIDFAGFAIVGPTACSAGACAPTGGGMGVEGVFAGGEAADNVTLENGSVRGAGRFGAALGSGATVERMAFSSNGDAGVALGLFGWVSESRAENNGTDGFRLSSSSRIEASASQSNGSTGIQVVGSSVRIEGCNASGNGSDGISGADLLVVDSSATGNAATGVRLATRGILLGSRVVGNTGAGVRCPGHATSAEGCLVADSVVIANAGAGLDMEPAFVPGTAGLRNVVLAGNTPDVNGLAEQLGSNLCTGALCP